MIVTCYFCNKDLPKSQMKRCSRCLLVTYCSKECQTLSWKASHKQNCKIHFSLVSSTDPDKPISTPEKPKKFSPEWMEIEADKSLSRWLQIWRSCFQTWGAICLDLANHPPERVATHCMRLIIQPRNFEDDPAKQYTVFDASVVPLTEIKANYPDLEVNIDPTDFTRLRFVLIAQNYRGETRRLRLLQWNDLNTDTWRKMDKEGSAALASGWDQALMFAVESMSPGEVDKMLGKRKGSLSPREVGKRLAIE